MRPAGARLAARRGDAWTCFDDAFESLRPVFLAELERVGPTAQKLAAVEGLEAHRMAVSARLAAGRDSQGGPA